MKFMIGENWYTYFERMSYRGFIGLLYESTWEGVLAYVIFGLTIILAIVGLVTVIKALFRGKNRKSDHDAWMKRWRKDEAKRRKEEARNK